MSKTLSFDLRVTYPGFTLAARADVPTTGITVLSGPSGSGKTTLLRALAGLETRAEGSVVFAGETWSRRRPSARGIGYVFQDARLFPHLSVAGNLDYGAKRRGIDAGQVGAVIEALDLGPLLNRAPATLSGGEARRVALGRALASGPQMLLLDEPLTGLDRARKSDLMPYIARAVASFGVPALYVTHSAHEIAILADRVLSILAGKLTGWHPAAPRLAACVVRVSPGQVEVTIGKHSLRLPGHGRVKEDWIVPLGEAYLISAQDPGITSAELTLPGHILSIDPSFLNVSIAGQELRLPVRSASEANWAEGQPLWLLIPKVSGHPASGGSTAQ